MKQLYMQYASEKSWDENKESILEVLQAVEGDHKDSDHLLAQLYEEEEAIFEEMQRRKLRAKSVHSAVEVVTVGAFFALAAAVAIRIFRQR